MIWVGRLGSVGGDSGLLVGVGLGVCWHGRVDGVVGDVDDCAHEFDGEYLDDEGDAGRDGDVEVFVKLKVEFGI